MAEPSNIRVNPFTGTGGATNYIELTEKHIIPAVSPYVIRLNEVPEKQDPSNMKMVYVNESTGAATSTTLTEVAATPGEGEFRPDYSTNAMEDKTWNTGLIEFSASDAGKIVQVTYTGTGTLAGVNSNHWPSWYTDRGDGSDGDFVPTENVTISGVKNYKSVFIKKGLYIKVDKMVHIKCLDSFINNGTIESFAGNKGTVEMPNGGFGFGGGYGGASENGTPGGSTIGNVFGLVNEIYTKYVRDDSKFLVIGGGGGFGSRDGQGGDGGGSICVVAKTIKNTGVISSSGQPGNLQSTYFSGGSGGGGGVCFIADTIIDEGSLLANGGYSIDGIAGAGGAGIVMKKQLGVL